MLPDLFPRPQRGPELKSGLFKFHLHFPQSKDPPQTPDPCIWEDLARTTFWLCDFGQMNLSEPHFSYLLNGDVGNNGPLSRSLGNGMRPCSAQCLEWAHNECSCHCHCKRCRQVSLALESCHAVLTIRCLSSLTPSPTWNTRSSH